MKFLKKLFPKRSGLPEYKDPPPPPPKPIIEEEYIKTLATQYANSSQFKSDFIYDWQSSYKGFIEGFNKAMELTKKINP